MSDKIEKKFSRAELADYLEALSVQLRDGKLSSDKKVWTVAEELDARIQVKEKKGRIELKVNCRWSTLGDYTEKDREEITDWRNSMNVVKKRMGTAFKKITRATAGGKFPAARDVDDLVETSRIFLEGADPEWQEAMEEYMDHLENFVRAVEGQQLEVMLHEIRDLQYRMKSCHKEYK